MTGISGFIAVLMGAAVSHLLAPVMDTADLNRVGIAASYQIYHTLALLAVLLLSSGNHTMNMNMNGVAAQGVLYGVSGLHKKRKHTRLQTVGHGDGDDDTNRASSASSEQSPPSGGAYGRRRGTRPS